MEKTEETEIQDKGGQSETRKGVKQNKNSVYFENKIH